MTTFNDRERSYEAKFAHDEELRFKATARRDKLLGAWAAAKLGLSGAEADDYAKSVMREEFAHPGEEHIINKLLADFKAREIPISEDEIRAKLVEFMAEAVAQLEKSRQE